MSQQIKQNCLNLKNKTMENKKIKSVKLAKDYRTHTREYLKGTVLTNNGRYWGVPDKLTFHIDDIINCDTGLFEIEYKDEHFEYVPTTYSRGITDVLNERNKDFLNKLADWCDAKFINKGFKPTKLENQCVIAYKKYGDSLKKLKK